MKRRQKNIQLKSMAESLHCAHYRTYPEEYRNSCLQFIQQNKTETKISPLKSRRDVSSKEISTEGTEQSRGFNQLISASEWASLQMKLL